MLPTTLTSYPCNKTPFQRPGNHIHATEIKPTSLIHSWLNPFIYYSFTSLNIYNSLPSLLLFIHFNTATKIPSLSFPKCYLTPASNPASLTNL